MAKYHEISIWHGDIGILTISEFVDEQGEARTGFTAPLRKAEWLLRLYNFTKEKKVRYEVS